MQPGAIIGDLDAPQLLVVVFLLFFFGLVLHLRREDKREGYPLVDPAGGSDGEGFPSMPAPKTFLLLGGGVHTAPGPRPERPLEAAPALPFPGSPLDPSGDPLADGVGPASWALRREEPLWFTAGVTQLAPLRTIEGWRVADGDVDPRGFAVTDAWGEAAGVVRDLWLDRGVKILRYLEVETPADGRALLPIHHTEVRRFARAVALRGVHAGEVAASPRPAHPDVVTGREDDSICAFYAGARFYADQKTRRPARLLPWERRRVVRGASR